MSLRCGVGADDDRSTSPTPIVATLARAHGTTYFWAALLLAARPAPPRVGAVRVRPPRRRHRRRPRRAHPVENAASGARRRSAIASSPISQPGRPTTPCSQPWSTRCARSTSIPSCFRRFLRSMAMDLRVAGYATWDDLLGYMDGSAAVIGELMLPVLRPTSADALAPGPPARPRLPAHQLPARRRRGPRSRPDLPAGGGPRPLRRRPDDAAGRRRRGATLMRFEIARCRGCTGRPTPGLSMLPALGSLRPGRRARSTPRSSSGSRTGRLRRVRAAGPGSDLAQGGDRRRRVGPPVIGVGGRRARPGGRHLVDGARLRAPPCCRRAGDRRGGAHRERRDPRSRRGRQSLPRCSPRCAARRSGPARSSSSTTRRPTPPPTWRPMAGRRVVRLDGDPPPGWTGKAYACARGAAAASGDAAAVPRRRRHGGAERPGRLIAAHARHGGLISVQPHHRVERLYEELSATCNVVAMMGSGAFAPWPPPRRRRLRAMPRSPPPPTTAHGRRPRRGTRRRHRGHRSSPVGTPRAAWPITAFAGTDAVSFRMYPGGLRQLVDGWTKSLAAGAGAGERHRGPGERVVGDGLPGRSACAASSPPSMPASVDQTEARGR